MTLRGGQAEGELGFEPKISCLLGKLSITEVPSQPPFFLIMRGKGCIGNRYGMYSMCLCSCMGVHAYLCMCVEDKG